MPRYCALLKGRGSSTPCPHLLPLAQLHVVSFQVPSWLRTPSQPPRRAVRAVLRPRAARAQSSSSMPPARGLGPPATLAMMIWSIRSTVAAASVASRSAHHLAE